MNSFKLQIQTPLKSVFNGEVNTFSVRTDGGQIQVLSKHADLTSSVSFSPVVITHGDMTDVIVIRNAVISFDNKNYMPSENKYMEMIIDEANKAAVGKKRIFQI